MDLYDNVRMEFAGLDCSTLEGSVSLELDSFPDKLRDIIRGSGAFSTKPAFIPAPNGGYTVSIDGVSFKLDPVVPEADISTFLEVFQYDAGSKLYLPNPVSELSSPVLENVLTSLDQTMGVLINDGKFVAFNTNAIPFSDFVGSNQHIEIKNNAFFLVNVPLDVLSQRLMDMFGIQAQDVREPGSPEAPRFRINQRIEGTPLHRTIQYEPIDSAHAGQQALAYARYFGIDPSCSVAVVTDQPGVYNDGYHKMLSHIFATLSDLPGVFYSSGGQVLTANRKK